MRPVYPDNPELNKMHLEWVRFHCQCRFRKEECDITWPQFQLLWGDQFHKRGRSGDDLVLTRRDVELPWTLNNAEVITRREQIIRKNSRATRLRQAQGRTYRKRSDRI